MDQMARESCQGPAGYRRPPSTCPTGPGAVDGGQAFCTRRSLVVGAVMAHLPQHQRPLMAVFGTQLQAGDVLSMSCTPSSSSPPPTISSYGLQGGSHHPTPHPSPPMLSSSMLPYPLPMPLLASNLPQRQGVDAESNEACIFLHHLRDQALRCRGLAHAPSWRSGLRI